MKDIKSELKFRKLIIIDVRLRDTENRRLVTRRTELGIQYKQRET